MPHGPEPTTSTGAVRWVGATTPPGPLRGQYWDQDLEGYDPEGCTPAFKENGGYDQNGDGFCAYSIWSGQRTTAAVKTTSLKGR